MSNLMSDVAVSNLSGGNQVSAFDSGNFIQAAYPALATFLVQAALRNPTVAGKVDQFEQQLLGYAGSAYAYAYGKVKKYAQSKIDEKPVLEKRALKRTLQNDKELAASGKAALEDLQKIISENSGVIASTKRRIGSIFGSKPQISEADIAKLKQLIDERIEFIAARARQRKQNAEASGAAIADVRGLFDVNEIRREIKNKELQQEIQKHTAEQQAARANKIAARNKVKTSSEDAITITNEQLQNYILEERARNPDGIISFATLINSGNYRTVDGKLELESFPITYVDDDGNPYVIYYINNLDLSQCDITTLDLKNCALTSCQLNRAIATGQDFGRMTLSASSVVQADFSRSNFTSLLMTGQTNVREASFIDARIDRLLLSSQQPYAANIDFTGTDFTGAKLEIGDDVYALTAAENWNLKGAFVNGRTDPASDIVYEEIQPREVQAYVMPGSVSYIGFTVIKLKTGNFTKGVEDIFNKMHREITGNPTTSLTDSLIAFSPETMVALIERMNTHHKGYNVRYVGSEYEKKPNSTVTISIAPPLSEYAYGMASHIPPSPIEDAAVVIGSMYSKDSTPDDGDETKPKLAQLIEHEVGHDKGLTHGFSNLRLERLFQEEPTIKSFMNYNPDQFPNPQGFGIYDHFIAQIKFGFDPAYRCNGVTTVKVEPGVYKVLREINGCTINIEPGELCTNDAYVCNIPNVSILGPDGKVVYDYANVIRHKGNCTIAGYLMVIQDPQLSRDGLFPGLYNSDCLFPETTAAPIPESTTSTTTTTTTTTTATTTAPTTTSTTTTRRPVPPTFIPIPEPTRKPTPAPGYDSANDAFTPAWVFLGVFGGGILCCFLCCVPGGIRGRRDGIAAPAPAAEPVGVGGASVIELVEVVADGGDVPGSVGSGSGEVIPPDIEEDDEKLPESVVGDGKDAGVADANSVVLSEQKVVDVLAGAVQEPGKKWRNMVDERLAAASVAAIIAGKDLSSPQARDENFKQVCSVIGGRR